jgi:hypothetical protein
MQEKTITFYTFSLEKYISFPMLQSDLFFFITMGLEDRINRLFIRMVMGGKHLKTEENTHNLLPETMSSMKRFFE